MYKISSQVIDFYDDQGLLLNILGDNAPDTIKKAHIMSYEQQQEMPDDEFAVVIMTKTGHKLRKYPISDRGHTWLSCESFKKTAHKLPQEAAETAASNLYSSCVYHNIECPKIIEKLASDICSNIVNVDEDIDLPMEYHLETKLANRRAATVTDSEWGLTIKTASEEKKMYPLNTKPNTEAAIRYFQKHANDIVPDHKRTFAQNIAVHADRFDVEVPVDVMVYASDSIGEKCASNIMARKQAVKTTNEKDFVLKLAKCTDGRMSVDKLLSAVKDFDKLAGLDKHWGKSIKDPYVTVLEKEAKISRDGEDMIRDIDIENYAGGDASFELKGHLPEGVVDQFLVEPIKTYNGLPDIQKSVVKRGILGVIK